MIINDVDQPIRSVYLPDPRSFHWRCISWSSDWVTINNPFLLSGLTILLLSLKLILPQRNSTSALDWLLPPPELDPNNGPPTAILMRFCMSEISLIKFISEYQGWYNSWIHLIFFCKLILFTPTYSIQNSAASRLCICHHIIHEYNSSISF